MDTPKAIHFDKFGRTYQVRIRDAEDLRRVLDLDESLWIATSAPIECLNGHGEFLAFVDSDGNGRIRTDELRRAVRWMLDRLADTSRLAEGTDEIAIDAISASRPKGRLLAESARFILRFLGEEDSTTISRAQLKCLEESLRANVINGDGVIPPDAAREPKIVDFIADVVKCRGGLDDLTGQRGINSEDLDVFLQEAHGYLEWAAHGGVADGPSTSPIMPLGADTPAAYAAFEAVREKIDEYFARCRMLWLDPERAECPPAETETTGEADAEAFDTTLARGPLAAPNPEGLLPLSNEVNPFYRAELDAFRRLVAAPLANAADALSEADWRKVKETLELHARWVAEKKGAAVEPLGREKLREYLDERYAEAVRNLLAEDAVVAEQLARVAELNKLLLYHRYLLPLANNFVSFPMLYDADQRAMFELGALVMDGRWFDFVVKVPDLAAHVKLAETSGIYVMYVELSSADHDETILAAVPAVAGTIGGLRVGKRGVFFETGGSEWDAEVVKIIDNPISFREALVAPFVRLGKFIAGKIESISGGAQKQLEGRVGKAAKSVQTGVAHAATAPATAPAPAPAATVSPAPAAQSPAAGNAAGRGNLLLGASVSVAALSSAFAFIAKQLSALNGWQLLGAAVALLLLVFLPSALMAGLKLRRRDLSAILEGCGWAINASMRLTRRQRRQFTRKEPYPADATGTPRGRWLVTVLWIAVAAAAGYGLWQAWEAHNDLAGNGQSPDGVEQQEPRVDSSLQGAS